MKFKIGEPMISGKKYRRKQIFKKGKVPMLSVTQISEKYGFHPHTVRAWVNRDGLKHVKHGPGGKVFIRQTDVENFMKMWYQESTSDSLIIDAEKNLNKNEC
jgi:hypothetical protein